MGKAIIFTLHYHETNNQKVKYENQINTTSTNSNFN